MWKADERRVCDPGPAFGTRGNGLTREWPQRLSPIHGSQEASLGRESPEIHDSSLLTFYLFN